MKSYLRNSPQRTISAIKTKRSEISQSITPEDCRFYMESKPNTSKPATIESVIKGQKLEWLRFKWCNNISLSTFTYLGSIPYFNLLFR